MMTEQQDSVVRLTKIGRRFGSTIALKDVDLELRAGVIHALVGQNGAGKSTCLGIIAGRIDSSTGSVSIQGTEYANTMTPLDAQKLGVAAIYQELSILPALSAAENASVGRLANRFSVVNRKAVRSAFLEACDRLGVSIDPDMPAGTLSLADQQMIEIIRALALHSEVLLLDEPTAALSPNEREGLFRILGELKRQGKCIVFVSHYLDEVLENADHVTVFRDGVKVAEDASANWTEAQLVKSMLGTELRELEAADRRESTRKSGRAPALRVEGLAVGSTEGLDFEVHAGEIVGIAGLVGSGRSTLMRALAGTQPGTGKLLLDGKEAQLPRTPRDAWQHGISLIPEDRKLHGLCLALTARENILLSDMSRVSRPGGLIRRKHATAETSRLAAEVGLAESMLDKPAGQLSGGNQQKILFARWLHRRPRVLLADEATRGIDISAKGQILTTLRRLADEGLAIVFVSSDLEEVAAISDHIYVLRHGQITAQLDDPHLAGKDEILAPAFGVEGIAS